MTATESPSVSKSDTVWMSSLSTIFKVRKKLLLLLLRVKCFFFARVVGQSRAVYLQLPEIEFELAELEAEFQVRSVFVPELVQRPLRLFHLNQ